MNNARAQGAVVSAAVSTEASDAQGTAGRSGRGGGGGAARVSPAAGRRTWSIGQSKGSRIVSAPPTRQFCISFHMKSQ